MLGRLQSCQPLRLSRKRHIAEYVEMRPQRIGLKNDTDAAILWRDMAFWSADLGVTEPDFAAIGYFEPGYEAQKRRFSTAGRADNREEFARRDVSGDTSHRLMIAERFLKRMQSDGHGRREV